MSGEIFKKFDNEYWTYLYCKELDITIRHVNYENLTKSYEAADRGKLYSVEKFSKSNKLINAFMTKHMILKAFKDDIFELKEYQLFGA